MTSAHNPKLYQHSGKVSYAPLLLIFLGAPVVIALSFIYSYLVLYIPLTGYVTVLLLAGYAFAASMTVSQIGKIGNCRNSFVLRVFGILAGLIGLYFVWVSFLYALFARFMPDETLTIAELMLNPFLLGSAIMYVNENGWFTIKGSTPTGILLWILWAIEAAVILIAPVFFAASSIENEMFCESCNKWCAKTATKFRQMPLEMESSKISAIDATALTALPEMERRKIPCIEEELLKCPACARAQGFRFSRVTLKADSNSGLKENSEGIKGIVLTHSL